MRLCDLYTYYSTTSTSAYSAVSGATLGALQVGFAGKWGCFEDLSLKVTANSQDPRLGNYDNPGMVICGARLYDSVTARWLTRDPIGYDGGINVYAYCDGNPVMNADPDGTTVLVIFRPGDVGKPNGQIWAKDLDTGEIVHVDNVFSGNGKDANNPNSQSIPGHGPVPEGLYLVGLAYHHPEAHFGRNGNDVWFKLYNVDKHRNAHYDKFSVRNPETCDVVKRGLCNLHTGRASDGCVTVYSEAALGTEEYPNNKQYDQLERLLKNTKPSKYKRSSFSGRLYVLFGGKSISQLLEERQ